MALQRIFLGAHHGGDASTRESKGPLDAFKEIVGVAARSIIYAAVFVVHARISGPATESFSEKFVANASRRKACLKRLAIELRKTKTGGAAADVTKNTDTASSQDGEKIGKFKIGMAHGEDWICRFGAHIHRNYTRGKEYFAGRMKRRFGRPAWKQDLGRELPQSACTVPTPV